MTTKCAYCTHSSYEHERQFKNGEATWKCDSRDAGRICNCRKFKPEEVKP